MFTSFYSIKKTTSGWAKWLDLFNLCCNWLPRLRPYSFASQDFSCFAFDVFLSYTLYIVTFPIYLTPIKQLFSNSLSTFLVYINFKIFFSQPPLRRVSILPIRDIEGHFVILHDLWSAFHEPSFIPFKRRCLLRYQPQPNVCLYFAV